MESVISFSHGQFLSWTNLRFISYNTDWTCIHPCLADHCVRQISLRYCKLVATARPHDTVFFNGWECYCSETVESAKACRLDVQEISQIVNSRWCKTLECGDCKRSCLFCFRAGLGTCTGSGCNLAICDPHESFPPVGGNAHKHLAHTDMHAASEAEGMWEIASRIKSYPHGYVANCVPLQ